MKRRRLAICLYVIVAVAWALRLHHLGKPELWFDEAASYFIASKGWSGIIGYVTKAPFEHPPSYYLLLHEAMKLFGSSEWALRFPSVLLGTLFLAGLWRAGSVTLGQPLAFAATVIASVSPFLVTYSQEARMYALLQCLGLLATFLIYAAVKTRRPILWLLYAIVMLLGISTHYFFAFLLIAHIAMLYTLSGHQARVLAYATAIGGLLVAALLIWLLFSPGLRQTAAQIWRESLWGKSPEAIGRLALDWVYGGAIISKQASWAPLPAAALILLALAGLFYRGILGRCRAVLVAWIAVPSVCAIAVPYGGLVLRHFSYIAPALYLLLAAGLLLLREKGRLLFVLGVVALATSVVPGLARQYSLAKGDYGRALAHVQRYQRPGDLLLLANADQWVLAYYYNRTNLPFAYVGRQWPLPSEQIAQAQRLWLLEWETWALPEAESFRAALRQAFYPAYSLAYSSDVSLQLLYAPRQEPGQGIGPIRWDGIRQLTKATLSAGILRPGDAALLDLFWVSHPRLVSDTALQLRLLDAVGQVWAEHTGQPVMAEPVGNEAGAHSRQALPIPGGTPPGTYTLELGVIDLPSGDSLVAFSNEAIALGPWLSLGTVEVGRGTFALPYVQTGNFQELTNGLAFLGNEIEAPSLVAGERWQGMLQFAISGALGAVSLRFSLLGSSGERWLAEAPLVAGALTAQEWLPGETWRCPYAVRLPPELAPGQYQLVARVLEAGTLQLLQGGWPPFGKRQYLILDHFTVAARPRHFVSDEPTHKLDAVFAGQIRLAGYDLEQRGSGLVLRLYWQALAPTAEPYKVFVHLTGQDEGQPLAQDDAPPATTPTSDWLSGESYVSEHYLTPPTLDAARAYVIRVGLYNERTMVRLPSSGTAATADHVVLPLK